MRPLLFVTASAVFLVALSACSSSSTPVRDGGASPDLSPTADLGGGPDLGGGVELGVAPDGGGADAGTRDAGPRDAGYDAGRDMGPSRDVRCGDPRPTDAPLPPPLPVYSGGTCPALVPGINSIDSGGSARSFILVTPTTIAPGEQLPLLFMWHWLGGDADGFLTQGNVQAAADSMRFIAAIPEKKGDVFITIPFVRDIDMCWPYLMAPL